MIWWSLPFFLPFTANDLPMALGFSHHRCEAHNLWCPLHALLVVRASILEQSSSRRRGNEVAIWRQTNATQSLVVSRRKWNGREEVVRSQWSSLSVPYMKKQTNNYALKVFLYLFALSHNNFLVRFGKSH